MRRAEAVHEATPRQRQAWLAGACGLACGLLALLQPAAAETQPATQPGGPALAAPSIRQSASIPVLPSPISPDSMGKGVASQKASPGADLAFGAFQRGYFATALSEAMKRLQKNKKDAAAMTLIAEIYTQGLAVSRDYAEAARWDRLASDLGNREAAFSYGMALLQGRGVPKDRAAAKAMFEKAAAQNHPGALYNLGVMAVEGDGKTRDLGVAAAYFQRAADAGDIEALDALSAFYKTGRGVAQDTAKATALLKRAADEKHVGAQVEYAIQLFNGDGVPKDEATAAHYFLMAAYQGNPVAENRLARLYAAGRGVPRDLIEAAHWHIMARAAGIKDDWLDSQLTALTPADKAKVAEIVRKQIGP